MSTHLAAVWDPDEAALARAGLEVWWPLADQGRYAGGDTIGALAIWAADISERARPTDLGARVRAWRVDSHVRKAVRDATVTMVALMRRRPDLTHEQFVEHWTRRHTPLALRHHVGLVTYTQHVVVEESTPRNDEVDGIAMLGFATRADFESRFYDTDAGEAAINADVREFMAGPGPDTTLFGRPVRSGRARD